MRDFFTKFSGVLEYRIIRLIAAIVASYLILNSVDVLAMGYVRSLAELTAVTFLVVYAGLRVPSQGPVALLAMVLALFVVSVAMFFRDMVFFIGAQGFDAAEVMMWSFLYGPYPGIFYVLDDAFILGSGKSIGWIQAALYLVVLSVSDGVTARKVEDIDLYMKVNMTARAGVAECVAMGCLALVAVRLTPFGGVFNVVAFLTGFFVTMKVPAVSGAIAVAVKVTKAFLSKPRTAAAPKGASVTEAVAQPPAPQGDSAVLPRRAKSAKAVQAEAIPTLKETLAARGKELSGISIASGESRRRALELGSSIDDVPLEPEPEIDTSDDEILLRSAASMEEAMQPVLMGFLAARIKPILFDVARIERLRQDRSLRLVIDSIAEYPNDLGSASDRYMQLLESLSGNEQARRGREEGVSEDRESGEFHRELGDVPSPDDSDDGFMSVEEASATWAPPSLAAPPEPLPAAAEPEADAGLGEEVVGEIDEAIEGLGGFGGIVRGPSYNPFDEIVDAVDYDGDFAGMEPSAVAEASFPDGAGEHDAAGSGADLDAEVSLRPAFEVAGAGVEPAAAGDEYEFIAEEAVVATAASNEVFPVAVAAPAEVEEMERPVAMVPAKRASSDENLIARAVPMSEEDVLRIGSRKIKSVAQGSLSAFANGLVRIVLDMRLGGTDEEDAVEGIQDRLPSGIGSMLDEARFLFGAIAVASGYSEQDRGLAKRRVAFLLTRTYRDQRIADVDAMIQMIQSGASVRASDVQDALRYVDSVCAIFPQLSDRESGADRYAVARAVLMERADEDRRASHGSSALEVGAQRMRDVASSKGKAVLDAAPAKVKSLVSHLEVLRGFFEHLISKASFDAARDHRDVGDHETREAADEVLALGQKAYADLDRDRTFVDRVVRAVRPMTDDSEVMTEFARIISPGAHGFFETIMLERRVPMRDRLADLEARLADAEQRAGEGSGALRSVKIAFDLGVKDLVDVVLDRVAGEAGVSGEEMGASAFPIMRALPLAGGLRLLTYSHTAVKTRSCAYLPVYGMGCEWSASQGDGDDFMLVPSNPGVPRVSLAAFAAANAQALSEAGVSDLKILLVNGTLDNESMDASVRSLGPGDAWDGDNTSMRSTAIKGNVLVMEDLAVRFSEPAVRFGMAARSGFNRHYVKMIS